MKEYISFEDYAYLDAFTTLEEYNLASLERMLNNHGPHRFNAAFVDTYKKVCMEDDGRLDIEKTRAKFMRKLGERLRVYSQKSQIKALSDTTEYVANRFGGSFTEKINDTLQKTLVAFVGKDFGERKIVKEFNKIRELSDQTESYNDWADAIRRLAA